MIFSATVVDIVVVPSCQNGTLTIFRTLSY